MSRQQIQFPVQQLHIATPAPPPAGSLKLYPKADNILYKLTSAGVESAVGVIPDPLTIGTLTVTTATVLNGTVGGTGVGAGASQVAAGDHLHAATYVDVVGDTMTGKLLISKTALGIATGTANDAQLEIQNASSGAAKIAFHRVGAFAAYFGVDTDNVWRIGGWSMGAAAYRIMLGDGYSNASALTITGTLSANYAVTETGLDVNGPLYFNHNAGISWGWNGSQLRTPNGLNVGAASQFTGHVTINSGYIFGSYINMTADVAGGSPVYVAGQNGDNYLRWYPKSVVGPIAQVYYNRTDAFNVNPGGTTPAITCNRAGYWVYYVTADSNDCASPNTGDAYVEGNTYMNGGAIHGTRFLISNQGARAVHYGYCYGAVLASGTYFQCNVGTYYCSNGSWSVTQHLWFVPTPAYPG